MSKIKIRIKLSILNSVILLILAAALSMSGGGGTVKVTEYVYTSTLTDSTGQPLANTTLKSEPPGLEGTTDANGNYQFTGSAGTYTVTVYNADGTESGKLQVTIPVGGGQATVASITGNVTMTAIPSGQLKLSLPTYLPETGVYSTPQTVSISCQTTGSIIYYTTDGSTPTTGTASKYETSINLSTNTLLKAICVKEGYTQSEIANSFYSFTTNVNQGLKT